MGRWNKIGLITLLIILVSTLLTACSEKSNTPDQFSTPEGTMQSLIEALKTGDLDKVLSHWVLTGNKDKTESFFKRYGRQGMLDYANYLRSAKLVEKTDKKATFQTTTMLGDTPAELYVDMVFAEEGRWAVLMIR